MPRQYSGAAPIRGATRGFPRQCRAQPGVRHASACALVPARPAHKADPAWFGIVLVTADGHVYEVGATRQTFTIQSISKPLVYGVALEDRGEARVRQAIGVEPSGEAFNSISLDPVTGRPLNPMINAGAIATAGMGFGESALIVGGERSADVRADTSVECRTLSAAAFAQFEHERPGLMIRLLHNLLKISNSTAIRLTAEVAALEA